MKDVIIRNLERLLLLDDDSEREQIEPMTEWKWNRLYQIVRKYELGPWIAEGLKAYENDFFLKISSTLYQQFMDLQGEKNQKNLDKFLLQVERSQGFLHKLSSQSLHAYFNDIVRNIKNIEE